MFHWAKVRHDEPAERTLLTAVACGLTREALNRMVFGPIQEREGELRRVFLPLAPSGQSCRSIHYEFSR